MHPGPAIFRSLTFRTMLPILSVICIAAAGLHLFVLRPVVRSVEDGIRSSVEEIAGMVLKMAEDNNEALKISGSETDSRKLRERQKAAVSGIGSVLRERGVLGCVASDGKVLPLNGDFPQDMPEKILGTEGMGFPSVELGGSRYYVYKKSFSPWNWDIYLLKDVSEYADLLRKTDRLYLLTFFVISVSAGLIFLYIHININRPIDAILESVRKGDAPRYEGIHEFERLGDDLRGIMDVMHRQAQALGEQITEREKASVSLRNSEAMLRTAIESIPFDLWVRDMNEVCVLQNSVSQKTWGDQTGRTIKDSGADPEAVDIWLRNNKRVLAGETVYGETEYTIAGLRKYYFNIISPIFDGSQITGILGLNIDITQKREAEEALRLSEERFRSVIETTGEWIWEIDTEGVLTYSNRAVEGILGYGVDEIISKSSLDLIHEQDRPSTAVMLPQMVRERKGWNGLVLRWRHKDGSYRFLESNAVPVLDSEENVVSFRGADRDITERKRTERLLEEHQIHLEAMVEERTVELRNTVRMLETEAVDRLSAETAAIESRSRYQDLYREFNDILNSFPDILLLLSEDLRIIWANRAAARYFGMELQEVHGMHCYRLMHDRESVCDSCLVQKTYRTGSEESGRNNTPDGRAWDYRTFPLFGKKGEVKSVIFIGRDITEQIRIEETAKRTYRLAQMGKLAAGIAHEINNPNNFIMTNSQLLNDIWRDADLILRKYYEDNGDFVVGGFSYEQSHMKFFQLLSGISEGSYRIRNIIVNLRNLVMSKMTSDKRPVDIGSIVRSPLLILEGQIRRYTEKFSVHIGDDLPAVMGNSQNLEQVVINLIMNALQSLPDRGCGVSVSCVFDSGGQVIILEIKDEGVGMTADVLEDIFTPFYTTKTEGGGIGLGLSISRAIVEDHGGSIEFVSSPGKGTTALVRLPVTTSVGSV